MGVEKTYEISTALTSQVIFKNSKTVDGKIYYKNMKKDKIIIHANFMQSILEY